MLNVEPHRLTRDTVPMICAKTGVPATRTIRRTLHDRGDASPWLLLLGWGIYAITRIARSSSVTVHLPISDDVRSRYTLLRVARWTALAAAVPVIATSATWYPAVPFFALSYGFAVLGRRAFATARWNGTFVRLDAHPNLLNALREPLAAPRPHWIEVAPEPDPEPLPPPAPGWYADPYGVAGLRLFDGTGWTRFVADHPA